MSTNKYYFKANFGPTQCLIFLIRNFVSGKQIFYDEIYFCFVASLNKIMIMAFLGEEMQIE